MNQDAKPDKALFDRVKDKFDRVLKRHIRRLLDANESENTPPYSLNMIACLLVLAEREKEISVFPGAPPKRYTRQTFLKDLQEIGIEPDDSIMIEIQDLAQAGYIYIGGDDEYRAREPALKILSLLDTIFPSMQGLSLIAYILQAVEEVLTNRKELINAVRQFDETLLTRGESVSKQRFEAIRRQRAEAARKKFDPAAQKQREAYLERLNALRSRGAETSSDPAIVTTTGYSSNVTIRDLFPKAPEEPEEPEPAEAPSPPPMTEAAPPIEPAEPLPEPPPPPEPDPEPVQEAAPPTPLPPENPDATPAPSAEADDIPAEEENEPEEEVSEEDEIAKRIKAFEEHLAMSCPVCKEGKILSDTTEKGKTYYYCSNQNCNLVTWGKPYHAACPVCGNPFLIEFQQQEGGIGLKCPRGTCSFVHRDFDGRHLPGAGISGDDKPVRKVAIRRKGGKRAVRRVVRRK